MVLCWFLKINRTLKDVMRYEEVLTDSNRINRHCEARSNLKAHASSNRCKIVSFLIIKFL
jgi:hypothetical protein